ncbi:hypothetical protein AAEX28_01480 [Lentisphaerota bacterium WC36G]|nr:hypothetical protein LJT99_04365 [Lentisphaerae bacterium WC36]
MKSKLLLVILGLFFALSLSAKELKIVLFGSNNCLKCERIEKEILQEVKDLYSDLKIEKFIIDETVNFEKLLKFEQRYGDDNNPNAAVKIFIGYFPDNVICLAGVNRIEKELLTKITKFKNNQIIVKSEKKGNITKNLVDEKFKKFSILGLIIAGLIDGVNPCVFSTIVFLMGLLSTIGVKNKKMLITGLTFCSGSFITYTLMGLGIFNSLYELNGFKTMQYILKYTIIAMLIYFAFVSFKDAIKLKNLGYIPGDACNLPLSLISKIRQSIQRGIKTKFLISGALFSGMTITIFESVCTGQVYIPVLAYLIKNNLSRYTATGYILIYNLACILPLIIIFLLVYKGLKFSIIENFFTKNQLKEKLILGFFFLVITALMIIY